MEQVVFNKSNKNPFMGLSNCLKLQQSVGANITPVMLDDAWAEVKNNKEAREMFFSILFSIGDITNRNHNLFKNKPVDNGGQSNREGFYIIMNWMIKNDYEQYGLELIQKKERLIQKLHFALIILM